LWSIARLFNNAMNTESFFFFDLVFVLAIAAYNIVYTKVIHATKVYTIGSLSVDAAFVWYFSYCRYLNGRDVITLRRSIQLLSHLFQLMTIGLLVLCHE
jgi:hypothetical protein